MQDRITRRLVAFLHPFSLPASRGRAGRHLRGRNHRAPTMAYRSRLSARLDMIELPSGFAAMISRQVVEIDPDWRLPRSAMWPCRWRLVPPAWGRQYDTDHQSRPAPRMAPRRQPKSGACWRGGANEQTLRDRQQDSNPTARSSRLA